MLPRHNDLTYYALLKFIYNKLSKALDIFLSKAFLWFEWGYFFSSYTYTELVGRHRPVGLNERHVLSRLLMLTIENWIVVEKNFQHQNWCIVFYLLDIFWIVKVSLTGLEKIETWVRSHWVSSFHMVSCYLLFLMFISILHSIPHNFRVLNSVNFNSINHFHIGVSFLLFLLILFLSFDEHGNFRNWFTTKTFWFSLQQHILGCYVVACWC